MQHDRPGPRPYPPPAPDGRPHARQPEPAHLSPPVWRRLLLRGAQHDRNDLLPRRGGQCPEPPRRARRWCRGDRAGHPRHDGHSRRCRPPGQPGRGTRRLRAAVHRDRAGCGHRGRRDCASWLQLGADHPLGRPDPEGRAGLRRSEPVTGGPGAAVRLQQRLPRHHRDQPAAARVPCWSATTSTPTRTSCSRPAPTPSYGDPYGLGRARHVRRRARAPGPRRYVALPSRAPASTAGSPSTPLFARRRTGAPAPTCSRPRRTRPVARSGAP